MLQEEQSIFIEQRMLYQYTEQNYINLLPLILLYFIYVNITPYFA